MGTSMGAMAAMEIAAQNACAYAPLLLMVGDADTLTPVSFSEALLAASPSSEKRWSFFTEPSARARRATQSTCLHSMRF